MQAVEQASDGASRAAKGRRRRDGTRIRDLIARANPALSAALPHGERGAPAAVRLEAIAAAAADSHGTARRDPFRASN